MKLHHAERDGYLPRRVQIRVLPHLGEHLLPLLDEVHHSLYVSTLELIGEKPTLIEWDADLPPLDQLVAEADVARQHLETLHESPA